MQLAHVGLVRRAVASMELGQGSEQPRSELVQHRPQVSGTILDGRPRQADPEVGLYRTGGVGAQRPRVLERLNLVEDHDRERHARQRVLIVRKGGIGGKQPVAVPLSLRNRVRKEAQIELGFAALRVEPAGIRRLVAAECRAIQPDRLPKAPAIGVTLHFRFPCGQERRGRDDEEGAASGRLGTSHDLLQPAQERDGLERLAETLFVGVEDPREPCGPAFLLPRQTGALMVPERRNDSDRRDAVRDARAPLHPGRPTQVVEVLMRVEDHRPIGRRRPVGLGRAIWFDGRFLFVAHPREPLQTARVPRVHARVDINSQAGHPGRVLPRLDEQGFGSPLDRFLLAGGRKTIEITAVAKPVRNRRADRGARITHEGIPFDSRGALPPRHHVQNDLSPAVDHQIAAVADAIRG